MSESFFVEYGYCVFDLATIEELNCNSVLAVVVEESELVVVFIKKNDKKNFVSLYSAGYEC